MAKEREALLDASIAYHREVHRLLRQAGRVRRAQARFQRAAAATESAGEPTGRQ